MSLEQKILKPGVWVRWESQSQGSWTVKRGEVLSHVPKAQPLPTDVRVGEKWLKVPKTLVSRSQHDRVLMAVVVNEATGLRRIYAPTLSTLADNGDIMGKQEVKTLLNASVPAVKKAKAVKKTKPAKKAALKKSAPKKRPDTKAK